MLAGLVVFAVFCGARKQMLGRQQQGVQELCCWWCSGHASFLTMILIFLFILAGIMLFDNMLPQFWEMFKKLVRDNFGIVGKVLLAAE